MGFIIKLNRYYKKYPHDKRAGNIEKIDQHLDNQEYKIAVVANMSSGKSTFINALFGDEVLPAFNHATTDCATFIYSKPNVEKKAVIYFSDKKKQVEIKNDIEEEIKQYAQKDEECENEKHKNVERIDLYYPFKELQTSSSDDFSITFVDTPGPNNTGEVAQKHKDQTRGVLNDVDLALFMFDYTQLDANLSSDEQGLWNTIKTRHEKDKSFDVYFLLNKIDYALDDNFKEIETKDKDEFLKLKKENWYIHEKSAIEKLNKAAQKHGIKEPKVYPIVSKFQLLSRDNNINWDAEDELESFQKSHFKRLFENSWEEKFIDYMGISKLEKDINNYINSSVKGKILKRADINLRSVSEEEKQNLERNIQILEKPKEQAEQNLKDATVFLQGRAKELQKQIKSDALSLEKKYIDKMETIVNSAIENELIGQIDGMSRVTIAFAQAYATGVNPRTASKKAHANASSINLNDKQVKIDIYKAVDTKDIMTQMQKFMQTIFEDYKNNYLDLKSDIKEEYHNFEREAGQSFSKYKKELEEQLENTLDVKVKVLETKSIDYKSMLSMDVKVPNSVLDYDFKSAEYKKVSTSKWYNPFSWGSKKRVKTSDEKHTFTIAPKELKDSIESSMEESISKFSGNEKDVHRSTIKNYLANNSDIFQEFRHTKQKEIDSLQEKIGSNVKNLKIVQNQYNDFVKITKD